LSILCTSLQLYTPCFFIHHLSFLLHSLSTSVLILLYILAVWYALLTGFPLAPGFCPLTATPSSAVCAYISCLREHWDELCPQFASETLLEHLLAALTKPWWIRRMDHCFVEPAAQGLYASPSRRFWESPSRSCCLVRIAGPRGLLGSPLRIDSSEAKSRTTHKEGMRVPVHLQRSLYARQPVNSKRP